MSDKNESHGGGIYLGTLDAPLPNVRLRDSTETEIVPYIAYWRTGDKQIDFPPEDEARQGWHCVDAGELLATCPLVEPIEPVKA